MPKKKPTGEPKWTDSDDAPELTEEWFAQAEIWEGGRLIRPGNPPLGLQLGRPPLGPQSKKSLTLRLDVDVIDAYRSTGDGWQSRINADLRKVRKLGKVG